MASVFKRDDTRLGQMKEADARERDPSFVSDAYAECYPGYHDFATAVVDSDDEDYQAMDSKVYYAHCTSDGMPLNILGADLARP